MFLKYNSIEIKKEKLYLHLYVYTHRHTHKYTNVYKKKKLGKLIMNLCCRLKEKNNPNLFSVKRQIDLVDWQILKVNFFIVFNIKVN